MSFLHNWENSSGLRPQKGDSKHHNHVNPKHLKLLNKHIDPSLVMSLAAPGVDSIRAMYYTSPQAKLLNATLPHKLTGQNLALRKRGIAVYQPKRLSL
jgi:hypothetical protein